jgi:serine/threonine protein kinase
MLQAEEILQNRYKLQRQLSKNPLRQTWLATDLSPQEDANNSLVVIKLLAFGGQVQWDDLKLFEREVQLLKQLNHLRIPEYLDHFCLDDRILCYGLVEEYIPGSSLQELLTQGKKFTEQQIRKIAVEVLKILIYLHSINPTVLHRDIKPSNLILGDDDRVYLIDFGAAQDRAVSERVTFTIVGTYGYTPLEQFGGRAVPASDLYGLGMTLIHLLTGIAPADLPVRDLRIQFSDSLSVSPSLIYWIEQLVEPAVERRFKSAKEALQALQANRVQRSYPVGAACREDIGNRSTAIRSITQPLSSQIEMMQSADDLAIKIPQKRMSGLATFSLAVKFLGLNFLGVLGLIPLIALFNTSLTIGFSTLIVMCSVWWTIADGLQLKYFGHHRIFITEEQFAIEFWLYDRCRYRQMGFTKTINDVFQSVLLQNVKQNLGILTTCGTEMVTIQAGDKRYSFGIGLTDRECVWLAREIKDWLNRRK